MSDIEMSEKMRKKKSSFNIGKMFSRLLYTNTKNKYFKNCLLKIM